LDYQELFKNRKDYRNIGFPDCYIGLVLPPMVGCNILYLFIFFFLKHIPPEAHNIADISKLHNNAF